MEDNYRLRLWFPLFDVIWNISRGGVKWNYYGTTKPYDRIMFELAEFGAGC